MATNGRLPASDLGTIPGTTRRLRRDLIAQTAALRDAFEARFGKPLVITDAYRDYATQERIFRQRYTTTYLPGRPSKVWNGRRWWQKAGTAMAATPGTSNHGWGQAIDFAAGVNVYGSAAQRWMARNASDFGWHWPAWAQRSGPGFEPWHYEAVPVPVSSYRHHAGAIPTVPDLNAPDPLIPRVPEEDDMLIIQRNGKSKSLIIGSGWIGPLSDWTARTWEDAGVPLKNWTDNAYDALLSLLPQIDPGASAQALLAAIRAQAGGALDVKALARELAPLVAGPVAQAVTQETGLTAEQAEAAVERGVRRVLGSLDE